MKYQTTIRVLLGLCFLLTIIVVILVCMYMHKPESRVQVQPIIMRVDTPNAPPAADKELPTYPSQNPAYPLSRQLNNFQQIGTLTSKDTSQPSIILPLFGRPMATRKERWEYYTTTTGEHMLKIPVVFEDKDCTSELGCREVYNNDTVFIPAYQKEFSVQLYRYRDFDYKPN